MIYRRLYERPYFRVRRPFGELEGMRQQMDQLFSALSAGAMAEPSAGVFPLTNLTEDSDKYYVRAELPGVSSDDLDIQVAGNGLSLSGERRIAEEGKEVRYHRREREAGRFSRLIGLPSEVDTRKVDASLRNGILTITIPKSEAAKPRQIAVR